MGLEGKLGSPELRLLSGPLIPALGRTGNKDIKKSLCLMSAEPRQPPNAVKLASRDVQIPLWFMIR
jgi:hypothetical protein